MLKDIEQIIYNATLAPSGHNTQPWKFTFDSDNNVIKIFPDYSRRLPVVDSDNHALFISLGCALENMVIASTHYGYKTQVNLFPDNEEKECLKVSLTKEKMQNDALLFDFIKKRQSTRNDYDGKSISEEAMQKLKQAAKQEDVELFIFSSREEKEKILPFINEAVLLQFSNKGFVNELSSWIRFNKSSAETKADGLNGKVMGAPSVPTWFGTIVIKATSKKREAAKTTKQAFNSSTLLLFIATTNTKKAWVNVGRSFERTALAATSLNIKHAHVNMPCEEIEIRKKLQTFLHLGDKQPMLLIRIGFSEPMPYSLRRPLNEVLFFDTKLKR